MTSNRSSLGPMRHRRSRGRVRFDSKNGGLTATIPHTRKYYGSAVRVMDERIERLWGKAEDAIDRGDIEQAEEYRYLTNAITLQRHREAKAMRKTFIPEATP